MVDSCRYLKSKEAGNSPASTQLAYIRNLRTMRIWGRFLSSFRPLAGDVIEGTGGLRKLRFSDKRRGKGKRSGIRVIYYWWDDGMQYWLFTLYDKDEASDLTPSQRKLLKEMIKAELRIRSTK